MTHPTELCADCDTPIMASACYSITVPVRLRSEYATNPAFDGVKFRMCVKCWKKMIGRAVMGSLR